MYKRHLAGNVHGGSTTPENNASQLRISVAMATYNGEKYIEEQLLSICRQTRKPDEIVISDDGSRDATLEVVARVAASEDAKGIDFVVITDNPRHGYCGNFEWAIQNTTGDLIFLSDQDDIWFPEKISSIVAVFNQYPDACLVCHNATLIGKQGEPIDGLFDDRLCDDYLGQTIKGDVRKLHRDRYLETSVSWSGLRGMTFCISSYLKNIALPFPSCYGSHDKWLIFVAILEDACFYLNSELTGYRLHGDNTAGNAAFTGTWKDKFRKIWKRILHYQPQSPEYLHLGQRISDKLKNQCMEDSLAMNTAQRIIGIGKQLLVCETSGRVSGAIKLAKLFYTDIRFRRSGKGAFVYNMCYILLNSRRKRLKEIGDELLRKYM